VDQGTLGGQGASGPKEQGLGVQSSLG